MQGLNVSRRQLKSVDSRRMTRQAGRRGIAARVFSQYQSPPFVVDTADSTASLWGYTQNHYSSFDSTCLLDSSVIPLFQLGSQSTVLKSAFDSPIASGIQNFMTAAVVRDAISC